MNPAGPPQAVRAMWSSLLAEIGAYPDPAGEPFLSAVAHFHGVAKSSVIYKKEMGRLSYWRLSQNVTEVSVRLLSIQRFRSMKRRC